MRGLPQITLAGQDTWVAWLAVRRMLEACQLMITILNRICKAHTSGNGIGAAVDVGIAVTRDARRGFVKLALDAFHSYAAMREAQFGVRAGMPSFRPFRRIVATAVVFVAATTAHGQSVDVVFVDPDTFDLRNAYVQTSSARTFYLEQIRRYIEQQAARRLPSGATLQVTITGIRLAGTYYATRPALTNVRVIQEVTPARIDLEFAMTSRDGATIAANRRRLESTGYPAGANVDPTHSLRYEKALIDDWLRQDVEVTK